MSKIAVAKLDLSHCKLALSSLETYWATIPAIRHDASFIENLADRYSNVEKAVTDTEERVNRQWADFEKITEKTDTKELETLLPEVERILVDIGTMSNYIAATKNKFEEVLTALRNRIKPAT